MIATKGNKTYTIDEAQKKHYLDSGFDIQDNSGEVVAYGRGKTVSFDDYMKAVREIEILQGKVAFLTLALAERESAERGDNIEPPAETSKETEPTAAEKAAKSKGKDAKEGE